MGIAEGGLKESILHAQTGLLAKDGKELAVMTKRVVDDPELRELLGKAALERARALTWDRSAETTLAVLSAEHGEVSPALAVPAAANRSAANGSEVTERNGDAAAALR